MTNQRFGRTLGKKAVCEDGALEERHRVISKDFVSSQADWVRGMVVTQASGLGYKPGSKFEIRHSNLGIPVIRHSWFWCRNQDIGNTNHSGHR